MDVKSHWESVYTSKAPDAVSWFRPHLDSSLALIERVAADRSSAVIDIGGGESTLVDDLLLRGYRNLTVLDVSQTAINFTRKRLGSAADPVRWLVGDITGIELEAAKYDLWHDRAVFHFLTGSAQRSAYVQQVSRALKPGGHAIVAVFGPEGPTKCSGLDVIRYDAASLHREFGPQFQMLESFTEPHRTPFGSMQQFLYCCLRLEKNPSGAS